MVVWLRRARPLHRWVGVPLTVLILLSSLTGILLGWGAIVALVACGAVLDGAHTFPGWQATCPVACALALLLVADSGGRHGVHRLLGLRSLRWLGTRSYALYLWHWPVLVL